MFTAERVYTDIVIQDYKHKSEKLKDFENLALKVKLKREEEIEKKRLEEEERKRKEEEKKINFAKSKGIGYPYKQEEFLLSFYTSLPQENGGYTVTCEGKPLKYGIVASNVYSLGTKIYLEDIGTFTVADRGGNHFNSPNRLDVLIPRINGETDSQYLKRVNNLGRIKVKGFLKNN